MNREIEKQFQRLAEEVDEKAQKIKCPIADYITGLETILWQLECALAAAREMEGKS